MIDDNGKERREQIFERYRELSIELNEISEKRDELRSLNDEKYKEFRHVQTIIEIMLKDNCCPVEAQLKYLNDDDNTVSHTKSTNIFAIRGDDGASESYSRSGPFIRFKNHFRKKLSLKLHKMSLELSRNIT